MSEVCPGCGTHTGRRTKPGWAGRVAEYCRHPEAWKVTWRQQAPGSGESWAGAMIAGKEPGEHSHRPLLPPSPAKASYRLNPVGSVRAWGCHPCSWVSQEGAGWTPMDSGCGRVNRRQTMSPSKPKPRSLPLATLHPLAQSSRPHLSPSLSSDWTICTSKFQPYSSSHLWALPMMCPLPGMPSPIPPPPCLGHSYLPFSTGFIYSRKPSPCLWLSWGFPRLPLPPPQHSAPWWSAGKLYALILPPPGRSGHPHAAPMSSPKQNPLPNLVSTASKVLQGQVLEALLIPPSPRPPFT